MDQVKKFFALCVRNGFWIGSGFILLGSLFVWFLATSSLNEELESRTSAINNDVNKVSQTNMEVPTAPNPISHQRMEELIQERTDEVVDAWRRMYERQREILTWPRKELLEDFVVEFENKIPIEEYVAFPTLEQDEVDPSIRTRYQYYIDRILPGLAEIAKAEWTASYDTSGGSSYSEGEDEYDDGGGYGRPVVNITGTEDAPLVAWSSGSQSAVLSDLFPWRGSRPTTLEVYYSQENVWILKQMLQVIADVNGDAELPFQAKIREIKQLAIGSSAEFGAGEILKPGEAFGSFGDDEMMDEEYEEEEEEYGDDEGYGDYTVSADPGDNRYVNTKLEPITGAQLRAALESKSPEDANIAVAKRVPVMMKFKMDQRAVPDLIAECGSAKLMIEVRQVRILPDTTSSWGGSDSYEEEGEYEEEDDGSGGGSYSVDLNKTPEKEFPYDMDVEVYGLIYIYNPPQADKLGVDQVDENTVIDGKTVMEAAEPDVPLPAPGAATADAPGTSPDAPGTAPATETPAAEAPDGEAAPTTPAPPTAISSP